MIIISGNVVDIIGGNLGAGVGFPPQDGSILSFLLNRGFFYFGFKASAVNSDPHFSFS